MKRFKRSGNGFGKDQEKDDIVSIMKGSSFLLLLLLPVTGFLANRFLEDSYQLLAIIPVATLILILFVINELFF